ncbi:MAG: alpha/beta hydrolase [Candidatus Sericytochromatia bacterium]|nr:alpha/beta hydrolase [Candidatus Sericytochromatia bacterium]
MNWLFLRGLLREQRHWQSLPQVFEQTVTGAKVYCLDMPGIGTEKHRPSPRSIAEIVEDLRARWLDLKAAHPGEWSIYSVSLGSMCGLLWCQTYPDDFKRLVVTGTSISNLSPFHHRFRLEHAPLIPRMFINPVDAVREKAILQATVSNRTPIDALAQEYSLFSLDLPTFRRTGLSQLYAGSRLKLKPGLKTPLLVLNSHGDKLVNPACSERVAAFFQAPLVSHPWSGHDLPLEDPAWVGTQVQHWVESTS